MHMIRAMKKVLAGIATLIYLLSGTLAFAVITPQPTISGGGFNLSVTQPSQGIDPNASPSSVISNALTIIFSLAAFLVLVMLIIGAFNWITSGGDKEKIGKARDRIINALIGLALLALAFLIVRVVGMVLQIDILNVAIPALGPKAGS